MVRFLRLAFFCHHNFRLIRSWMALVIPLASLSNLWRSTLMELGKARSHWWDSSSASFTTTFHLLTQVGSILAGFIMLVGPISSAMVNKFGPRLTCIGKEKHWEIETNSFPLSAGACISAAAIFMSTFSPNVYVLMVSSSLLVFTILLKLSLQRSLMGSWVVSVSGWCMSPPSLLLATGSRKSAPLSPVRFVTLIYIWFAMLENFQKKFFFYIFVPSRNLNMWFWIWDNCLCPSGDPPAGLV